MKVEAIEETMFCHKCRATVRAGYCITGERPAGVESWLCTGCFLGYLQGGVLHLGPEPQVKTVVDADRHQLTSGTVGYCEHCPASNITRMRLDDTLTCQSCLIKRTTDGDLAIVTPKAGGVITPDVEAPFEVAWE